MIIAQITDLHMVERGQKLGGLLNSDTMVEAAVTHLNQMLPRPDVVLVTGDLTDHGTGREYAGLRECLDTLAMPYYVIPGNHDQRAPLREHFGRRLPSLPSGFFQYAIDDHPVRLLALDTVVEGQEHGLLCHERLQWLAAELERAPDRPTLIFMHHPPFQTGIWWMDAVGLSGAPALRHLIAEHPQVQRIICGHLHRPIQTNWGSTLISVAPSTAYQVHLDLRPESAPHVILEPPACQLHTFTNDMFVTHTSYVNFPQAPIDLSQPMHWDVIKPEMQARMAALQQEATSFRPRVTPARSAGAR